MMIISDDTSDKVLVVFDVDGTLINEQTQKIFLNILRQERIATLSDFMILSFWFIAYKLHIIKDTNYIRNKAYAKLCQRDVSEIKAVIDRHFIRFQEKIFSESRHTIQQHRRIGHKVLLCSASIAPIVEKICQEFQVQEYLCTELEIIDHKFTGKIKGRALYGSEKLARLKEYLQQYQYYQIWYYTDHISDLKILEMVNIPICINPDPKLRKIANSKKWRIYDWK